MGRQEEVPLTTPRAVRVPLLLRSIHCDVVVVPSTVAARHRWTRTCTLGVLVSLDIAPSASVELDWNVVYTYKFAVVLGNLATIRGFAYQASAYTRDKCMFFL
jgi:hypothetical protein